MGTLIEVNVHCKRDDVGYWVRDSIKSTELRGEVISYRMRRSWKRSVKAVT